MELYNLIDFISAQKWVNGWICLRKRPGFSLLTGTIFEEVLEQGFGWESLFDVMCKIAHGLFFVDQLSVQVLDLFLNYRQPLS